VESKRTRNHNETKTRKELIMTTKPIESVAFGRGRQSLDHSVCYNGLLMTFLATSEDTQGQFALIEVVGRKGNVPPPHIHHREDETFYLLEGELTVSVGDRVIKATPGTMVFLPRNVQHSFTIDSEQGRMLVLLAPAGLEGFFKEFSMPAPAMTLPPEDQPAYDEVKKNARGCSAIWPGICLARSRIENSFRLSPTTTRYCRNLTLDG
jgi:quercetin dioxygenase-like cupin family protein